MTLARVAAGLCCAALLAGCGGGGKDDTAGYERALNSFCSAMENGAEKVASDSQRLTTTVQDKRARLRGVGGVLGTFATTMQRAVARLRTVDVPSDYEKLNGDIVDGVGGYVSKLREASRQAASGNARKVQALSSSLKNELPVIPKALADKTPACGSAP